MSITTITKKGQITIPVAVRKALSLKERDKVIVRTEGKRAVIEKAISASDLKGSIVVSHTKKGILWEKIVEETRKQRAER